MQFKTSILFFFVALLGLTFSACVDQVFDEPPVRGLPDLTANYTIQEVKDLYNLGGTAVLLPDDAIISGVVVGNDVSGNIFKQLIIQDETGGITLSLDEPALAPLYPLGTEVFVILKSLYIGEFGGRGTYLIGSLDGNDIQRLAAPLVGEHVFAGEDKGLPTPKVVTINDLENNGALRLEVQSTLIQIDNVQFPCESVSGTYAVQGGGTTRNVDIEDCDGNTITTRLSDFSDFAGTPVAGGNGTVTAVMGVFLETPQLLIRDNTDFDFGGERCGPDCASAGLVSIGDIRAEYANGVGNVLIGSTIRGVVISDRSSGNFNGQNAIVQDGTAGIVVRFNDDHDLNLGEEVEITVANASLGDFNGLVQVSGIEPSAIGNRSNGTLPTPRVATVADILANGDAWESTLVQVENAMLTGGPTFGDGATVGDGTGTLPIFTFFSANFSNEALPTSMGTLTAILGDFNGLQLNMRNISDADFEGTTGGNPTEISTMELREMFENGETAAPPAKKLRGVVISDVDNGNLTGRNLVIQDETGGIVIRFENDHAFALGEELEINVSSEELSEFNGLLQVNNVPNSSAVSFGPGTLPTPQVVTIQEILDNSEAWESTLVTIEDVTIQEGGTYDGPKTVEDATGTIAMFTRGAASFSGANVPTGEFIITAIVSQFNDPQITIRNLNDIQD